MQLMRMHEPTATNLEQLVDLLLHFHILIHERIIGLALICLLRCIVFLVSAIAAIGVRWVMWVGPVRHKKAASSPCWNRTSSTLSQRVA
jgi:hypothetical protein